MEVKDKKTFSNRPGYSIEWGYATWTKDELEDDKDYSIRNRYNKEDGGYNHAGSSEIPWWDFNAMIKWSILKGKFSNEELGDILSSISDCLKNSNR